MPLSLEMSLPSLVGIAKIDLEKSASMWFFNFYNKIKIIIKNDKKIFKNRKIHQIVPCHFCCRFVQEKCKNAISEP